MKNNLPVEYQNVSYHWNHDQAKIVENRIVKALASANMVNTCSYKVRVIQVNFKNCFTRVYIGGYFGGKKVIISSKANQSVDMDAVIKAIRARTMNENREKTLRNESYDNERTSHKIADKLNKMHNLSYSSKVHVDSTTTAHLVEVNFKMSLTKDKADEVIQLLKGFIA